MHKRFNGLALSRAALIDWYEFGPNAACKIGPILLDAQRRRPQRRVGPPRGWRASCTLGNLIECVERINRTMRL